MQYTYFLGIDVSKATLDCCLRWRTGTTVQERTFHPANPVTGHQQLMTWLTDLEVPQDDAVCCLEHTGVSDDQLLATLTVQGWTCALEKTTVTDTVSPEHHYKTDTVDAARLAEYAERFHDKLAIYRPPEAAQEELRALLTERNRLVVQRQAAHQKQQQAHYQTANLETLRPLWEEQVALLTQQIDTIEARIDECSHQDTVLSHRVNQVASIPGVGPCLAPLWVSLFAGEPTLNPRQIASRFGFAPHVAESGTSRQSPATSTGHGDALVRKTCCMAALSVQRHWPKMAAYKAKKEAEGKPGPVITNNIINRLIRILCAIWNANSWYDPEYVSPFAQGNHA